MTRREVRTKPPVVMAVAAIAAIALVAGPLLALLVRAPWRRLPTELTSAAALDALRLSMVTSLLATALACAVGIPLAWVQARVAYRGRTVVRALTTVPMVLPPVVGGTALLLALGRRGIAGRHLDAVGVHLPFHLSGAVLAEAFVAMPFLVLAAEGAFRSVDARLEDAARTMGATRWGVFRHVTLPLARPSLVAGLVVCWARALGEFGATITFAGNSPGRTQTLPLFVYVRLEAGDQRAAIAVSLLLLAVALVVLVALRDRWWGDGSPRAR